MFSNIVFEGNQMYNNIYNIQSTSTIFFKKKVKIMLFKGILNLFWVKNSFF